MSEEKDIPSTEYKLEVDNELRFEIESKNERVTITVCIILQLYFIGLSHIFYFF